MVTQFITRECECDDALSFFLDFNELETYLYFLLVQNGEKTISELCDLTDRNQSTVYTAIEKLVSHGICTKTKRGKKPRGYEYVYNAYDPKEVKQKLLNKLERLYKNMKSCIESFDTDALTCETKF